MSTRLQWLALIVVLGATLAGFGWLYQLRLDQGDSFPMYSSMRSDPFGTRVLYDSLAELPGLQVSRRFEPLQDLDPLPRRTILIAGLHHRLWENFPAEAAKAIDRAAKSGDRVILAMFGAQDPGAKVQTATSRRKPDKEKDDKTDDEKEADKKPPFVDLGEQWAATPELRWLLGEAERAPGAPAELPRSLKWESDVFLRIQDGSPWRVLYRRDNEPVLAERPLGRGSLVVVCDSYLLSNEALQRNRSTDLLVWLVGPNPTIEFDEGHLGVVQDPGVAALARNYGLTGAFVAFLVAALIFVWHRIALFVPPAPEDAEVSLHYNQTAGLEALLRRAISPKELVRTCAAEWRKSARPAEVARAEAALQSAPNDATPATLYNLLVRTLRRR